MFFKIIGGILLRDIEDLAVSGARYDDAPEMIDVILPAICRYLPQWIDQGPESQTETALCCTEVNSQMMNSILGNVLRLIYNNLGTEEAEWMKRIAVYTQPIMVKAGADILSSHFLPILEKTLKKIERTSAIEEDVKNDQVSQQDNSSCKKVFFSFSRLFCLDLFYKIVGDVSSKENSFKIIP